MSSAIVRAIQQNSRFYQKIVAGEIEGYSVVHKFGKNKSVGTSYVPIAIGGIYRTPQSAVKIRVKAGNASDDVSATGAWSVGVIGLDASGNEITEILNTNGASAGASSSASFLRAYRAYVNESGTYATQSTGSHIDPIVIENVAGSEDWLTIDGSAGSFAAGQSECAAYTIPSGYKGYVLSSYIFSDSAKTTDFIFFRRESILDTTAPYQGMRALLEGTVEGGQVFITNESPIGPIQGPADVGFLAKVDVGTALVTANFEILLIAD